MDEKSSLLDQRLIGVKQAQERDETKEPPLPRFNCNSSPVPVAREEQLLELPPTPTTSVQKLYARSFLRSAASTGVNESGVIMGSFDEEDELDEVISRKEETLIDMADLGVDRNNVYETDGLEMVTGGHPSSRFSNSLSASASAISSLFGPSSDSSRSFRREEFNNIGRAQHAVSNLFGSSLVIEGSSKDLNVGHFKTEMNQEASLSMQQNKVDTSKYDEEHHLSQKQARKGSSYKLPAFTSIANDKNSGKYVTERRKMPMINSKMNPMHRTVSQTPSLLDDAIRTPEYSSESTQTSFLPSNAIYTVSSDAAIDFTSPTSKRKFNLASQKNASHVARSWFGGELEQGFSDGIQRRSRKPLPNPQGLLHGDDPKDSQRGNDKQALFSSRPVDKVKLWNGLNLALSLSYGFTTAASVVPITLIPTIAIDILSRNEYQDDDQLLDAASTFASTVTMYAVLGTAFGKFLNGPIGDIFGARRIACLYAFFLSSSLLTLSFGCSTWSVIFACVAVEYYQSVQWPCIAVILAAHYGNTSEPGSRETTQSIGKKDSHSVGAYETGIYVASLGSRSGALCASLSTTMLLRYLHWGWRAVARLASLVSAISVISLVLQIFVFN